tara:strand:+ start:988 stop:1155 length:168 start_codon:yes stop_codon:yes gene_type:complete
MFESTRNIINGENLEYTSRFKYVREVEKSNYQRLTPIGLERRNIFPDNHFEESDI